MRRQYEKERKALQSRLSQKITREERAEIKNRLKEIKKEIADKIYEEREKLLEKKLRDIKELYDKKKKDLEYKIQIEEQNEGRSRSAKLEELEAKIQAEIAAKGWKTKINSNTRRTCRIRKSSTRKLDIEPTIEGKLPRT